MNNVRRKQIDKAITVLTNAIQTIERIRDEEEEYMDNMPENLQGSSKYSAAEEAYGHLDDAVCWVETAIEELENAKM